jgi:DNA polymerase elongation subunit (family B)
MKTLVLDIETAPNVAHLWGLFRQTVGISQIMQTGRVMCFAAKWLGEEDIEFWSEHRHGHKRTVKAAHKLIGAADAILTYNGRSFDLPTLNKEFIKYGIKPPSPYHDIDLLAVARRKFRFASNKLDLVCRELGLGAKTKHTGHDLWVKCMNGDDEAWKVMEEYNRQDVALLEKLYHRMLPWIETHPNQGLYGERPERPTCTNCGSTHMQARGSQKNRSQTYARWQCQDCGTWQRSRYTLHKKNVNVLTQIGG